VQAAQLSPCGPCVGRVGTGLQAEGGTAPGFSFHHILVLPWAPWPCRLSGQLAPLFFLGSILEEAPVG
jgi:hypothetical protein